MKSLVAALAVLGLGAFTVGVFTAGAIGSHPMSTLADGGDSHGHNSDTDEDDIPDPVQDEGPNKGTGALIDAEKDAGGLGPQAAIPGPKEQD
ncbi:MAG: hypothetical protein ACRC20_05770 [Segniliparus sp.]|uniref:hypothetical protein n=1 Tax=Segniliparus sp. TaxID=2804064 RepID=UPI003F33000C